MSGRENGGTDAPSALRGLHVGPGFSPDAELI
jgi:hypothetical protein